MAHPRWFLMPPHHTPEPSDAPEQKPSVDVYRVLRDHVSFAAAIRAEIRQARRDLQELKQEIAMKVSELSSKVDELISAANQAKSQAEAQAAQPVAAPEPPDDPQIEQLSHRIEDAIEVLKGGRSSNGGFQSGTGGAPGGFGSTGADAGGDPNAPAQPSQEALDTDINSASARDPNSPL